MLDFEFKINYGALGVWYSLGAFPCILPKNIVSVTCCENNYRTYFTDSYAGDSLVIWRHYTKNGISYSAKYHSEHSKDIPENLKQMKISGMIVDVTNED